MSMIANGSQLERRAARVCEIMEQAAAPSQRLIRIAREIQRTLAEAALLSEAGALHCLGDTPALLEAQAGQIAEAAQVLRDLAHVMGLIAGPAPLSAESKLTQLHDLFQAFTATHGRWIQRARARAAGGEPIQAYELISHSACMLGQPALCQALADWDHLPEHAALTARHRDLHRAQAALVIAHQQRRPEAAADTLARLDQSFDDLNLARDLLMRRVAEETRPVVIPLRDVAECVPPAIAPLSEMQTAFAA